MPNDAWSARCSYNSSDCATAELGLRFHQSRYQPSIQRKASICPYLRLRSFPRSATGFRTAPRHGSVCRIPVPKCPSRKFGVESHFLGLIEKTAQCGPAHSNARNVAHLPPMVVWTAPLCTRMEPGRRLSYRHDRIFSLTVARFFNNLWQEISANCDNLQGGCRLTE